MDYQKFYKHNYKINDLPSLALFDLARLIIWLALVYYEGFMIALNVSGKKLTLLTHGAVKISRAIGHILAIVWDDIVTSVQRTTVRTAKKAQKVATVAQDKTHTAWVETAARTYDGVETIADATRARTDAVTERIQERAALLSQGARGGANAVSDQLSQAQQTIADALSTFWGEVRFHARQAFIMLRQGAYILVDGIAHPSRLLALPDHWRGMIAFFVVSAVVCTLPFPAVYAYQQAKKVQREATASAMLGVSAVTDGVAALAHNDVLGAQQSFQKAAQSFETAEKTAKDFNPWLFTIASNLPVQGNKISASIQLLEAGQELAAAGQNVAHATWLVAHQDAFKDGALPALKGLDVDVAEINTRMDKISRILTPETIAALPPEYRDRLTSLHEILPAVQDGMINAAQVVKLARGMAGEESQKKYLVLFQNNAELRPTGGFMGSFAVADVDKGMLKQMTIPGGGPYVLKGALRANLAAPAPLQLINTKWQFQDANWFPDFPTSAQKVMWFYEQSGQSSVDGVVAVNASLIESLLAITGPIEMPEYRKVITAENALLEMQKAVELEYDRTENKPKQFIADLMPRILEKVGGFGYEQRVALLKMTIQAGLSHEVQAYVKDSAVQANIVSLGLAGEIQTVGANSDYLMIVDTNIGGAKSDRVISSEVDQTVTVQPDGSLLETITMRRMHDGTPGDPFTGRVNLDYVRFYAPKGSKLVSAEGFAPPARTRFKNPSIDAKVDADLQRIEGDFSWNDRGMLMGTSFDKTVFANWIQTAPRQSSSITVSYLLPFTWDDLKQSTPSGHQTWVYNTLVQRQSGVGRRKASFHFVAPTGRLVRQAVPSGGVAKAQRWDWQTDDVIADQPISVVIE